MTNLRLRRFVYAAFLATTLLGCVTTPSLHYETVSFKTLLKPEDAVIRATVLVVGVKSGPEYSFCNGTYTGNGEILTAAHCLVPGFSYFIFVPMSISSKGPVTDIALKSITAKSVHPHKEFVQELDAGKVRNDIGMIKIDVPKGSILRGVRLISQNQEIKIPRTLRWQSGAESYFSGEFGNQIEIAGFKFEKNISLKGIHLTRDSTNLIGRISPTSSFLIALNPGTPMHRGVSGSGVFLMQNGEIYLAGVASHIFPGLNLLSAVSLVNYLDWVKSLATPGNNES